MKGKYKKKILITVIAILFQLILFGFVSSSNAYIVAWDLSEEEGARAVMATLYSNGEFVISGTGAMKDYANSEYRPYNDEIDLIKTVKIDSGITNIGENAFTGCTNLTNIELSDSVTSIGDDAFYKCTSLTSINVDENNQNYSSENGVLFNKDKTEIISYPAGKVETEYIIPNSVTSIGDYSFEECTSLTNIEIAEGVTSIGSSTFKGCTNLTSINVDTNNQYYTSIDGVLFDKYKTELIQYPAKKKETEYIIPNSVTSIDWYAFQCCINLTSIEIPNSVTSIGWYAFQSCTNLTSIKIPNSVTDIGWGVFACCTSLTSIEIPDSVTSIGYYAFYECTSLTSIEIPEGVTSIGICTFAGCTSLTSIEMPDSVTDIAWIAFAGCTSLRSIEIPNGVTWIGDNAFSWCTSLTSIEIPNSVTSIGKEAFYNCESLTNIKIPNSVTSIGDNAFSGAKLTVAVASGVENIQELELPNIIQRAMNEEDILYTENNFTLANCNLSEDKTKLLVDTEVASTKEASLEVTEGALNGLTVIVVVPSGTMTYSTTEWTNKDVIATVHLVNGETIKNNDGKNTYAFTENGTFTFEYLTAEGEEKEATAKVENIDKTNPTISNVTGNPTQWTKDNVTLTVTAQDTGSGIESYSFDGGNTWQNNNTKSYTRNTVGIVIKVKDQVGNIATYNTVNITKIEELTIKNYENTEENGTKYIENIKPGESIQAVINNIETNGTVEMYKGTTKITDKNAQVSTGMTIKIAWGTVDEETYTIVVTGDLNGDGQMGNSDLLRMARYKAKLDNNLTGAYLRATDIYKDGKYADNKDLLKIARVLAELESL